MNSTQLIKLAKDRFNKLKDKNLDWNTFYTAFLIGYGIGIYDLKH